LLPKNKIDIKNQIIPRMMKVSNKTIFIEKAKQTAYNQANSSQLNAMSPNKKERSSPTKSATKKKTETLTNIAGP